ncbi:hypothetical protein QQF48_04125 [Salmonella enterica subsp. enterica serovar Typhimurium]|nr:hypothetical protein [Salmonella enterica]MCF1821805.1 hypothetical protein [Salmonella enterica subsp. enterica serovar Anatum]MCG5082260.1 hypothetical protein [Salmonella enterica subsp. enterica serovar Pullorum]MCZ6960885.1 hypothetical protein [Salmonella enterica]MCZ6965646.1 hypothetical protein [Salmonella enterica]MCZ6974259.1 hypothetical protein [Salmonella enterica]
MQLRLFAAPCNFYF